MALRLLMRLLCGWRWHLQKIRHKRVREYQLCGVHANKPFSAAIWSCAGRLKRVIKHILPPLAGSAEPGIGDAISFLGREKVQNLDKAHMCALFLQRDS